jgi:hypothetical protein
LRNWVILLGLAVVLAALLMACGQSVLTDQALRANAALAGNLFTIPLAASVKL